MTYVRFFTFILILATYVPSNVAHAKDRDVEVRDRSGWSLHFTPVLLFPTGPYGYGGGADPELRYTLDLGGAHLSAGTRIGAYHAKDTFGITAMPTLRLTVPVGPFEPYVAFGMGYGWLPKLHHDDIATMSRLGFVIRVTPRFGLGFEGTVQRVFRSEFQFTSFGSMVAFDF